MAHLVAISAFASLLSPVGTGRGVVVADRDGLGIASVAAGRGKAEALARHARERFGLELPKKPQRMASGDLAFVGVGPGAWLATHERGSVMLGRELASLGDLAATADQSDGYAVLRLTGPRVRDALAKLVFIDLHPDAFAVGSVASTQAAHLGVILWRLDDAGDGAVFEIAMYRSFAGSFWHALSESAAEFGLQA